MKILVLNLQGAQPNSLFGDERLKTFRHLMNIGCFGTLNDDASAWNLLASQEHHNLTIEEYLLQAGKRCATFEDFLALRAALEAEHWDYYQLNESTLRDSASFSAESASADPYLDLDREVGEVLPHLSEDTVIAIIGERCFVLASANLPLSGEVQDRSAMDLAPTLLELAGYPLPSSIVGKSWVAGIELKNTSSGLTAEEEEILRERLSGLGYI